MQDCSFNNVTGHTTYKEGAVLRIYWDAGAMLNAYPTNSFIKW